MAKDRQQIVEEFGEAVNMTRKEFDRYACYGAAEASASAGVPVPAGSRMRTSENAPSTTFGE